MVALQGDLMMKKKRFLSSAPTHCFRAYVQAPYRQICYLMLSIGAERTLLTLIRYATFQKEVGDTNFMIAYPSVGTLALQSNQHARTVQRALRELEKLGLIRIEHRGSSHQVNRYDLSGLQARLDELVPLCEEQGHGYVKAVCPKCKDPSFADEGQDDDGESDP
jgi:hypothetical protein